MGLVVPFGSNGDLWAQYGTLSKTIDSGARGIHNARKPSSALGPGRHTLSVDVWTSSRPPHMLLNNTAHIITLAIHQMHIPPTDHNPVLQRVPFVLPNTQMVIPLSCMFF